MAHLEGDVLFADRMHVKEREIAPPKCDEVTASSQVRLDLDSPALARYVEAQVAAAVRCDNRNDVTCNVGGRRRLGQRFRPEVALDEDVRPERRWDPSGREVGERTPCASGRKTRFVRQVPSSDMSGCRCWNPVRSRRTTIRCTRRSCSSSNDVTGWPSGPTMVNAKCTLSPAATIVGSASNRRPPSAVARPRACAWSAGACSAWATGGASAPCRACAPWPLGSTPALHRVGDGDQDPLPRASSGAPNSSGGSRTSAVTS